jgi:hypothetical protein
MAFQPTVLPDLNSLQQYSVNRPNQLNGQRWELYDRVAYPTGGQTNLDFFQVPQGGAKTLADTNMEAAGQMPAPKSFFLTDIQVFFLSGFAPSAVLGVATNINDAVIFYEGKAWAELFIGSTYYVQQAPIGRFPPRNGLNGFASIPATDMVAYATYGGAPYKVEPQILIPPNQNFRFSLKWPAALGITTASSIMVVFGGYQYRLSQ